MKDVLVTAIGSFSADIVIKNLHKQGYKITGCDIYPKEWIADASQVDNFYQAPYVDDTEKYLSFIQRVCIKEDIKYIIPLTDVEVDVLNHHREWFEERTICLCMSPKETLDICRNKKALQSFVCGKFGINTIPSKLLKDFQGLPNEFPVVCKPFDGRSSQGLKYINNISEWNAYITEADKKRIIVQPYIKGHIVTVDVVRQPSEKDTVAIARKELLRTLNGAGTSVYVFSEQKLENQCINLANALNIAGCVNFEFIVDSRNDYYLLECNPRFSGGVEFSCIAGYDCVKNHMHCFSGERIDAAPQINNQYIARKYEEFVTYIE